IGIGAGPDTAGQVLVLQDMLGLSMGKKAKFVRQFSNLADTVIDALKTYAACVKDGSYPSDKESYH
ncbi:MAG: 3-methyl-2-oxobutanoate hydroxymethyltransferase, partial [Proteobacteria bacterium]|nr:3-methyl-2-oxobutanoate hydroxymethyltransferase [Pseudomonadota bacterium]